jgi:hypothetical protein
MIGDALKNGKGRIASVLEKILGFLAKVATPPTSVPTETKPGSVAANVSSLSRILTSAPGLLGEFYFPNELIGGCCPRVVGQEEEIVWNAAAEACDTERVHVVWQAMENRIWYIAVRSAEIASHPNTWCPFASLLPGMKDAQSAPVCYTYYSDEAATMMTITADGLQIHRSMSSVVRAKAERMARELGDAPIIELVPERILKLTPAPWYSLSLFEDRARRVFATMAVFTALAFAGLAFAVWLLTTMVIVGTHASLKAAQQRTESKTIDLMHTVSDLRASPMREQLANFADVNDGLLTLNGYLEVYEINDSKARWRAVAPANITADRISALDNGGGRTIETTADGVVIGNVNEVEYEVKQVKK